MLPSFPNNVLPTHYRSDIVCKYSCHCDGVYVGRTSQPLIKQILQHVPKFIRNQIKPKKDLFRPQCKSTQNAPMSNSAIGQH